MEIIVTRDGQLDPDYHPEGTEKVRQTVTEATQAAIGALGQGITALATKTALEARMYAFDKFHGTNYRDIRHTLVEEQKRRSFEARIGLIAMS